MRRMTRLGGSLDESVFVSVSVRERQTPGSPPQVWSLDFDRVIAGVDMLLRDVGHGSSKPIAATRRVTVRPWLTFERDVWMGGFGFVQPLRARLEASDGEVVAVNPETDLHGVGDTPAEAIADLRASLFEHLRFLQASRSDLGTDLEAQRIFLARHIADAA